MDIENLSLQFADIVSPFLVMMIGITIALWVKDLASDIAKGISFKYFGPFKEGDKVVLDGHKAVIVKIGLTISVFGCDDENKGYIWRYVPNDRIGMLQLGKIISSTRRLNVRD